LVIHFDQRMALGYPEEKPSEKEEGI